MPHSYSMFDEDLRQHILRLFPLHEETRILDLGAGAGKYADLLYDYPIKDAVEIYEPYVTRYRLRERYRNVYVDDLVALLRTRTRRVEAGFFPYDLVLLGDVLEHLTVADAIAVLDLLRDVYVIVAVPFLYEQGAVDGVESEVHLQPDLTPDVMRERYPSLSPLVLDERYGIYVRKPGAATKAAPPLTREKISFDFSKSKTSLMIATPIGSSGELHYQYVSSLLATTQLLAKFGVGLDVVFVQSTIEKGRNILVADFLSKPHCTHLLFVDSDQGWDPNAVLRLIALDRDVIGIAARKKVAKPVWAVNFPDGPLVVERGAVEVVGIGCGFLMIKRGAIERMVEAYPELTISDAPETEAPKGFYHALFQFSLVDGPNGRAHMSEDFTFCRRWREIGGRVFIDPTICLSHVGSYDYRGSVEALLLGEEKSDG